MKIKNLLLGFFILSAVSCSQIVDNIIEHQQQENYVSPYKGTYVGTYSGVDSGALKLEVGAKDGVTVTRTSTQNQYSETFTGTLVGMSLSGIKSQTSGFTLNGNFSPKADGTYSGTWLLNSDAGSWVLRKQ